MKENLTVKAFDYSGLDPDLKGKLICLAGEINRESTAHIEHALKMGEAIASVHEILATAGCKGKFSSWIEMECGISKSTAYNYMAAWQRLGESSNVGRFAIAAIYVLSAPAVPQLAVDEAEKLAGKGVRITVEKANEIANKFRAISKPKPNGQPAPAAEPAEPPAEAAEEAEPEFDTEAIEAQPHPIVDIAGLASPYKAAVSDINRILRDFEALANIERTGVHLADKFTRIKHDLTEAKHAIYQAEPVQACEKCDGKGCKSCYHSGFWTRAIVGSRKK